MSSTLALSASPGDAVFSVGALLAATPGDKHHVTAFGSDTEEPGALELLGTPHADLNLAEGASAKTVESALTAGLERHAPTNVLLPLGLRGRAVDTKIAQALPGIKRRFPATRFLHYYDLPYVNLRRSRYPELAFARAIQGLAEADADAATLNWKARGGKHGAGGGGVLQTKLAACDLLRGALLAQLFPDAEFPPPAETLDLDAAIRRGIGAKEWVQLA